MQLVFSAFPGTGKSTIFKEADKLGLRKGHVSWDEYEGVVIDLLHDPEGFIPVFDSDSSIFSKHPTQARPFPENYIAHIRSLLEQHENVIILVSSHDNVREELRTYGIDYTLVFPERELKEEYLRRYMERGNVQGFIEMMDANWNKFIDSCIDDLGTKKIILGEGEYLIDKIDILGSFPGLEELILERNNGNSKLAQHDKWSLVAANLEMGADIEVLSKVVEAYNDPDKRAGMEGYEDNGPVLKLAAEDILKRYKKTVEPTIAGMEGFLTDLKNAFSEVFDEIKGKPSKSDMAKIKRYLFEASNAIKEYSSPTWLNKQTFINVGKAKFEFPVCFKEVGSVDGVNKILDVFIKTSDNLFQENFNNSSARQRVGMPIFSKFVNKGETEGAAGELAKHLPIKPAALPRIKPSDITGLLDVKLERGELPVLSKDKVKDVVAILIKIVDTIKKWEEKHEKLFSGPSYDDFYNSDFFDPIMKTKECQELIDAVEWESSTLNVEEISESYRKIMIPVAKFLEMWILKSVK